MMQIMYMSPSNGYLCLGDLVTDRQYLFVLIHIRNGTVQYKNGDLDMETFLIKRRQLPDAHVPPSDQGSTPSPASWCHRPYMI